MENGTAVVWQAVLILLVTAAFLLRHLFFPSRLPPGPRGLPLLGNLLGYSRAIRNGSIQEWIHKYGPIINLQLGAVPTIFVAGRDEVKELLLAPGGRFDSRPYRPSRAFASNKQRNVNTSPYGPRWRELRKNLTITALGNSKIAAMAPFRRSLVDDLVKRLREHAHCTPQLPVPVLKELRFLAFKMLLYIIFGNEVLVEDEEVRAIDDASNKMFSVAGPNIGDYLPFLAFFVNRSHNERVRKARSKFAEIAFPLIAHIRQARKAGNPIEGSYVDSLVKLEDKGVLDDEDDYLALCTELLNAGTDTTSNSLEFAMAELVKRQEMQSKLAAQIETVCGDRPIEQSDIEALPYLRAVVLETLRRHPPANYTLAHQPSQDELLGAYVIPRNSEVLACIDYLGMDPELWHDPQEFIPERFLEGPPVDITGSKGSITMIPFGAGRRICPGMNFALLHMHLMIGRLVQEFRWLPPVDGEVVDVTHFQVFTVGLKHPLQARIQLRRPV